jgi:spore coat polysaccharide biosynthesis protein SpsF
MARICKISRGEPETILLQSHDDGCVSKMKVVALLTTGLRASLESEGLIREVAGKPLLAHALDRVSRVDKLDAVAVAATDADSDDAIADFCKSRGTACFRGDAEDGLGRLLAAFKAQEATAGVIISSDALLVDPATVDHVANLIRLTDGMVDWIGTPLTHSYPRGMEVEAFTVAALDDSNRRCVDPAERREGTAYLRTNSRHYRLLSVTAPAEVHRPDLDMSSTQKTMPVVEAILSHFAGRDDYGLTEMIAFLDAAR